MGYFVKDRYCDGREYEIFEANDSLSKFRDIGELDEFFAQLTSAPTLRFDNEGTAEIVINGLATGMMKHKMFHLCSSHHWGLFSNESLESINTDVLFNDLDKFLPYNFLNETQKITVLNRLLPRVAFPLDEVICAGETTNGATIRGMKIRSGDKTIEAELHYRNDAHGNNSNKYMFVISAHYLIGFDGDLDFSKVNLPSTLWKNYYSIETNGDKVLCKDCIIEDYQGFGHFFGGLDPLEHESEKRNEIFNNLWADGHHQKAKDMLCHQLLKDFGGEALSNAEIVETAKGRKDGFRFSSDEMSVSVSFNKEWVAKMWVDSNNMYSGGYVPSAY